MMSDRTVHGMTQDGGQIVRYDRAGKWWIEYPPESLKPRRSVTLAGAVAEARRGRAFLGRYGGRMFDAAYRKGQADE